LSPNSFRNRSSLIGFKGQKITFQIKPAVTLNYYGGFFIVDFLVEVCYKEVSKNITLHFNSRGQMEG